MDGRGRASGSRESNGGGDEAGLIDIDAVAKRLGVEVRHVRRLVSERRIPFIKWGHLLRFERADIEAWIDSARKTPGG